jgi:hypothetical protein
LLCGIRHVGQTATSTTLEVKPAVRIRVDQDIRLDPKIRVYPVSTLGYSITYRLVTSSRARRTPLTATSRRRGSGVDTSSTVRCPEAVTR